MHKNIQGIFLIAVLILSFTGSVMSQSLQTKPVTLINNLSHNYSSGKKIFGKTSSCPTDTVNYAFYKATTLTVVALNNSNSGNVFAQWFDAPQPLIVSGFDFFGWQSGAATNQSIPLNCRIYNANPADSTPMGSPLASVTVSVDSTFGGGVLSALRHQAVFANPVTVNGPYIITVETASSVSVSIVTNSWTATPPNGRSEWLSSVHFAANTYYARSYNVNVGGIQFNADFIYEPYVTYQLTADFAPSSLCNVGGNQILFTNTSSPVLSSRFYNTRAYYNITYISCMWDYGDTSGTWYAFSGLHTYNYRAPYNVKLRDTIVGWTTGCGDSKISPLQQGPPGSAANSNSPVCIGSTLKLFADTVASANGYYWTGPNGYLSTLQNPTIPNVGVAHQGTYFLRAVMGQCTSMVATTLVTIQTTPQAASNSPLCAGQTLALTISSVAGATYSWSGPNGFNSTLQSPTKLNTLIGDSGTYSVLINSPGCGTIGPFTQHVSVNPVPATPTAANNGPLCVGDNLNLSSTGVTGSYSWTGPNGYTASTQNLSRPAVQASFAGIYSVNVSANGCTSAAANTTVVVNNNPTIPVTSNNGPLCIGQTLSLTASLVSGATYQWSGPNGFTSALQNPVRSNMTLLDGGNYSVITKANGCSSAAATTAVAISTSTPTPGATYNGPLCPGQTLQLFASSIPGATYSWTGPNSFSSTQQNPSINNIATTHGGTYSVTAVTSGCGASSAGNIAVSINTLPSAPSISNNGPLCDGDSLMLTANSIPGATYNWSGPDLFTSNAQNPVLKNMNSNKDGIYSVYIDVTGCGSSSASNTVVHVRRIPQTPSITGSTSLCEGDSLKLNGTSFGTGINRIFQWNGPNNFTSSFQNIGIGSTSTAHAGVYSLSVVDSGCSSSAGTVTAFVKSKPTPPLASNNGPVCNGNDIQLNASAISGASYKWSGPGGYLSAAQSPILFGALGIASGTYFVTAAVNGCNSIPAQTNVYIYNLPPTPIASNDGPQCQGNPVSLSCNPMPNVIYSWTGPLGFTSALQNPVIANAKVGMSGIYSLSVVDSHCVSLPDTTLVTIYPIPSAPTVSTFPASGTVCAGDSLQLYASFIPGVTYEWHGPAGFGSFIQNPVIHNSIPANSGTYTVFVSKSNCTSTTSFANGTVNPLPLTGSILGPDSALVGDIRNFQISGDSGSVFNWVAYGGAIQGAATGTSINVKWNTAGSGFVRARETGIKGCKGLLQQQNVYVTKPGPNGLNSAHGELKEFEVYPVPAGKKLNMEFSSKSDHPAEIIIFNMLGEKVFQENKQFNQGHQVLELNIENLANGIYSLVIEGKNYSYRSKIEVLR